MKSFEKKHRDLVKEINTKLINCLKKSKTDSKFFDGKNCIPLYEIFNQSIFSNDTHYSEIVLECENNRNEQKVVFVFEHQKYSLDCVDTLSLCHVTDTIVRYYKFLENYNDLSQEELEKRTDYLPTEIVKHLNTVFHDTENYTDEEFIEEMRNALIRYDWEKEWW